MATPPNQTQSPLNFLGLPETRPGTSLITENPGFLDGAQAVGYSLAAGVSHARALMAESDQELELHRLAAEEMTRRASSLTNEASLANLWGNAGAQILGTAATGGLAGLGVKAAGGAALARLAGATAAGTAVNAPAAYNESVNTQLDHGAPYKQALSDSIAPAMTNAALDSVTPMMMIAKGLAGKGVDAATEAAGDGVLKQFGKMTGAEALTGAAQTGVNIAGVDDAYQKYGVFSEKGIGEMAHAGMMEAVAGAPYTAGAAVVNSAPSQIPTTPPPPVDETLPPDITAIDPNTGEVLGESSGPLPPEPDTTITPAQARASRAAELLANASKGSEFLNLKQLNDFTKQLIDDLGGDQNDRKALAAQLMAKAKQDFNGKSAYNATTIAQELDSRLPIFAAGIEQKNAARTNEANKATLEQAGVVTPSTGLTEQDVAKAFGKKVYDAPALELPNGDLFGYDNPKQLNANLAEVEQRFTQPQAVPETFDSTPTTPGSTPQVEMFGLGGQVTPQAVNMPALPAPRVGLSEDQITQAAQQLAAEQASRPTQASAQATEPVLMRNQALDLGGNQAIPVLATGEAMADGFGNDPLKSMVELKPTSWKQDTTVTALLPKGKSASLRKAVEDADTIEQAIANLGGYNKGVTRQKASDLILALNKLLPAQGTAPATAAEPTAPTPALQLPVVQTMTQPAPVQTATATKPTAPVATVQPAVTPAAKTELTDADVPATKIKLSSRKTGYKNPVAATAAAKKAKVVNPLPVKLADGTYGYTSKELLDAKEAPLDTPVPAELVTNKITAKTSKKGITAREWLINLFARKDPLDPQLSEKALAYVASLKDEPLINSDPELLATLLKDPDVADLAATLADPEMSLSELAFAHLQDLEVLAQAKADIAVEQTVVEEVAEATPKPVQKKAAKTESKLADQVYDKWTPHEDVVRAANAIASGTLKKRVLAALKQTMPGEAVTSLERLKDEYEDNENFVEDIEAVQRELKRTQRDRGVARAAASGNAVTEINDPAELARIAAELEANAKTKASLSTSSDKLEQIEKESYRNKKLSSTTVQEETPLDTNVDKEGFSTVADDTTGDALLRREVRVLAENILSEFTTPPNIEVILNLSKAPASVKQAAEKAGFDGTTAQVKGFFHKGTMYIVSSAHTNKDSVERTVYHEAFHLGLRQAVSPRKLMAILNAAIDQMGGKEGIIKFAKQMGTYDRLVPYIQKYDDDVANGTRSRQSADRMLLEETLAPLAETRSVPKLSGLSKFLGAVARALEAVGAVKPAAWVRKWSPKLVAQAFLDLANRGLDNGTVADTPDKDAGFMAVTSPSQLSDSAKRTYKGIKQKAEDTQAAVNKLPYRTFIRRLATALSAMGGKGAVFTARQLVSSTKGMLTSLADSFETSGKPELAGKLRGMMTRLESITAKQDTIANEFLGKAFRSMEHLPEASQKKTWEVFQLELTPEQAANRLNAEEMQAYRGLRDTFNKFFDRVMRPAYEREANILLADGNDTVSVMELAVGMGDYVIRAGQFERVAQGQGTHRLTNYRANYSPRIYDREKIRANQEQFVKDIAARTGMSEEQATNLFDDIMDDTTNVSQIGQAPVVGMGKTGSQKARKINLPNAVFDGYLSKDLGAVLPVYLNRTVQHSLFTQEFGRMQTAADGSLRMTTGNEWAEIHNAIDSEDDRVVFRRIMNTVTSRTGLTDSSLARTASSGLRAFGSIMMMSLILLKSLGDVAWIAAAGKNGIERQASRQALKDIVNAMMKGEKARSVAANRIFYQHAGLVTNAVMDRTLADLTDVASTEGWEGKFNRATTKFYQRTGIHHLTTILRNVALDAGQIAVDHSIAILADANTTEKEKADAKDTLARFGVDSNKWNLWKNAGKPTVEQAMESGNPELAAAAENAITTLTKFRNSHVAHPTQLDKTLWADNAIGKLFWQFHGYFYALQNNVMTGFFDNIMDHKGGEAFKQMAIYIPVALVVGGAGLYAAHALQYAAPAAFWGDPLPPHSMTGMDFGEAAIEALKYTALSGFSAESWSTAATMPGGFMDVTNLAPSVGLFTRTLDVDSLSSAPEDLLGNAKSLADNLLYAAAVYKVWGPGSDKIMEARQREIERLTK